MVAVVSAPFTPEQVVELWKYQLGEKKFGHFPFLYPGHPFTCANRGDGQHREIGSDLGMLIPTTKGWVCPFCNYVQSWAHAFMCIPLDDVREQADLGIMLGG